MTFQVQENEKKNKLNEKDYDMIRNKNSFQFSKKMVNHRSR